jgi:multidrug resistance efflux pump
MATETHLAPAGLGKRLDGAARDPALDLRDDLAALPAMLVVDSGRRAGRFHWWLPWALIALVVAVAFMPWQQSVSGNGRVVAFDPFDRRVNVEAQVAGVVRSITIWEGKRVARGDLIVEIQDNDPNLINNLRLQQNDAIFRRLAASNRVAALDAQITEQNNAMRQAVSAGDRRVDAAVVAEDVARRQYDRIKSLFEDKNGLASQRDFEVALREYNAATNELARARFDLARIPADFQAVINGTRNLREIASADINSANQQATQIEVQINQNLTQVVRAPRDGIVLSVAATAGSFLRPGSPICVIIPQTESRFVEVFLDGNDMPLAYQRMTNSVDGKVTAGSDVRLQFEGWPAVAIIGPYRAPRGTFGGEVVLVDPLGDKGKFRVLIAPKPDLVLSNGKEVPEEWPPADLLRQGVRAQAWVLAAQVPLWYEIWRQLNGFPANPAEDDPNKFKASLTK